MSARVTNGSIENIEIDVTDVSGAVTDLSASSPHFDVWDDTTGHFVNDAVAVASGMVVHCLINTTTGNPVGGGAWPVQHYKVYVKFTIGAETPRLGPFDLYVI